MLVCSFVCANRTRDRGCSKHPVFPAPSRLRDKVQANLGRKSRRENADTHSPVIVRGGGRSGIPETSMIESISRSVLDARPSRGMTVVVLLRRPPSLRAKRSNLSRDLMKELWDGWSAAIPIGSRPVLMGIAALHPSCALSSHNNSGCSAAIVSPALIVPPVITSA
jgi:hypothetical protein